MAYDDATNAAMLMGGMYGPNQYSQFPNGVPMPGYRGIPTDAMGNPIQSPPGMTLNSSPATAAPAPAPAASAGFSPQQAGAILQSTGHWGLSSPGGNGMGPQNDQAALDSYNQLTRGYRPQQQGAAAPQAATATQQPGGSWQNTLAMLGDPGKVTTPGATVPQSTIGGQPSVLQQFLANQHGGAGSNTYSNAGFFDTLNALGGK